MKHIDPNHEQGVKKVIASDDIYVNDGFLNSLIVKLASLYMRNKTKEFLDFKYDNIKIDIPKYNKDKQYLLYLHIPFCKTLCPYCSFHKFKYDEQSARNYFKLLHKELELIKAKGFDFIALYIGGGTTTILPDELASLIEHAQRLFSIKEVSCEADPLIDDTLVEFLSSKVDRLSIGVQTTDDDILKRIKRFKKFGSSKEQLERIEKAIKSFKIVNVDLIFNLPGQSVESLKDDLAKLIKLSPHQISIYPLMYSPSVKKNIEKNLGAIANDKEVMFYNIILETLKDEYDQISSWTFAKKDIKCFDEYVVEYNEYIGLGSGSFSFIDDKLYINTFSLKKYKEFIQSGTLSFERLKEYKIKDIIKYQLMLDLFSNSLDIHRYKKTYGIDIQNEFNMEIKLLRLFGILKKGSFETTPFGKYLFLILMKEFYIGMDFVRESSRSILTKEDRVLKD